MKKKVSLASSQSQMRVAVSEALAVALITGIDECTEEHCELTQVQRIHMAKMHIMSYQSAVDSSEILDTISDLERSAEYMKGKA